jgi:hypothetical protein
MSYIGSWKIDDLLTFVCNTQVFSTGVATDADSVPTYRVYEDETTTPILTGSMALLDSSNTAGFYSEQITLSAANGFEKGKCYSIYIAATVSSVAGATHRTFQIEAEVDANRINWANVDNPTTTVGLSGTTIKTATDVETDTQDIQSRLPSALTGGKMESNIGSVTAGAIAAAAFAANALDAVWSTTTRILTAGTNIVLAKGTGVTGFNDLSQADVRSAVGLASANLDTQLADIDADVLTRPTAVQNATELLDQAAGVEANLTVRQGFRLWSGALLGKASGLGTTTAIYRDTNDTVDRITATVDADGNRTAVVLDPS